MLQYIKKYIKGWVLGIILFFIFISFTFWGVGDIFRGGDSHIIKIGKYKISRDIFLKEFDSNVRYLKKNKKLNKAELETLKTDNLFELINKFVPNNIA